MKGSLSDFIQMTFSNMEFTLQDVYKAIPDKPKTTIRGRIYDNLGIKFDKVSKGVYKAIKNGSQCIVIEGNGRDLSMIENNSIDCIITDHPWDDQKSNTGCDRKFTDEYSCFKYSIEDFKEKCRVLKDGCFLVEILPAENENNFEYLYEIKKWAKECGLLYYSKVPWKKGSFVSNTGRKSKNTEDIMIFSKGKARSLRIDVKNSQAAGVTQYMSGSNGMLPTVFDIEIVSKKEKIHQAEKPVKLYEEILNFLTLPNETVLDQFAGSGALGEAALNKGRNCVLFELLKENVNKITNRINCFKFDMLLGT